MLYLQLCQVISLMVLMSLILLACSGVMLYVILKPAREFKEDIEFKPMERVKVKHARNNRID